MQWTRSDQALLVHCMRYLLSGGVVRDDLVDASEKRELSERLSDFKPGL